MNLVSKHTILILIHTLLHFYISQFYIHNKKGNRRDIRFPSVWQLIKILRIVLTCRLSHRPRLPGPRLHRGV